MLLRQNTEDMTMIDNIDNVVPCVNTRNDKTLQYMTVVLISMHVTFPAWYQQNTQTCTQTHTCTHVSPSIKVKQRGHLKRFQKEGTNTTYLGVLEVEQPLPALI